MESAMVVKKLLKEFATVSGSDVRESSVMIEIGHPELAFFDIKSRTPDQTFDVLYSLSKFIFQIRLLCLFNVLLVFYLMSIRNQKRQEHQFFGLVF